VPTVFLAPAVAAAGPLGALIMLSQSPEGQQRRSPSNGAQLDWLGCQLAAMSSTWVAITTRPCRSASPGLDAVALQQPERLLTLLTAVRAVKGGVRPRAPAGRRLAGAEPGGAPCLACPFHLFAPLRRPALPAWTPRGSRGRWLELGPMGCWRQELLRWSCPPFGARWCKCRPWRAFRILREDFPP